jgi:hypothetical protein
MSKLILAIVAASFFVAGMSPAALAASAAANPAAARAALLDGLKPADEIAPRLANIKASIVRLSSPRTTKTMQMASLKTGLNETNLLDQALVKLRKGFETAENRVGVTGGVGSVDRNREAVAALREAFQNRSKELEAGDKLDNFEIQDLMSKYNQAETTSSAVKKKIEDTHNAVASKIG